MKPLWNKSESVSLCGNPEGILVIVIVLLAVVEKCKSIRLKIVWVTYSRVEIVEKISKFKHPK